MPGKKWNRVDWLITAALFLGTFFLRIPFRTTMLYAWDSVLYTRAIERFDITIEQPQPPGHIFYVGLVRLVNGVLGDPNAAMVWISIFSAAAAAAALYWLGRTMFGRDVGLVASLLLATSLSFWSQSEVALPYTLLGFLSIAVAGMIYLAWRGGGGWVLPSALALGLASGFRQDLLPFLLPLLAVASWNKGRWRLAGAVLMLAAGITAWYIPSALLSGGFGPYRQASAAQSDYLITWFSVFGRGGAALATNSYTLLRFLVYALSAALLLVPVFMLLLFSSRKRRLLADRRLLFLAVWMAPSVLFYIFIHIGEFGYVFSFLPALLLLLAWGLQSMTRQVRKIVWACVIPLLIVNLLMFLILSPPLSANRLAAHDDILRSKIETIRENFNPETTLIISVFDYQQASYYLPGFHQWNFDPSVDNKPATALPEGVDRVVIFEEYLAAADAGNTLTLPLDRDQTLVYMEAAGQNMEAAGRKSVRVDWDARKVYLGKEALP